MSICCEKLIALKFHDKIRNFNLISTRLDCFHLQYNKTNFLNAIVTFRLSVFSFNNFPPYFNK